MLTPPLPAAGTPRSAAHRPPPRWCRPFLRRPASQSGFTLIEALVALTLLSVLLAYALPAGHRWLQRQRLWQAAETVLSDLHLARSEALQGGRHVMLRVLSSPSGACYVIYSGPLNSCSCELSGPASCLDGGQPVKTAQWPRRDGFPTLLSNVPSLLFNGRQGTVALGATLRVSSEGIGEVRHVVSITGRVRSCAADRSFARWPACEGGV